MQRGEEHIVMGICVLVGKVLVRFEVLLCWGNGKIKSRERRTGC